MRKLVVFPSDPIETYLCRGRTYEYLEGYYNPGKYFDEVYCLSPWGEEQEKKVGTITYIRENPCKFRKIIKRVKPDVIRGYGGYWCADWISINKIKGIPTLVSVHDTNPDLIYDSLRYADFIVCMAECVKQAVLSKVEFDENKIWVMPNRVDTALFCKMYDENYFRNLNERFGNGRHILHVGRKAEQKNLDTLIKAMRYLNDDVNAVFVGGGDYSTYKKLAEYNDVAERCFFVESVQKNELPLWYSWCDCFCTPSRWEGFGYVFIEAAACEAPIVTSNIAPMNEYLTNGVDAILVDDYENPRILATAIKNVLFGGEHIDKMRMSARNVGLHFEKEKIDQMEVDIYKKIISSRAGNLKNNSLRLRFNNWRKYR